MWWRLARRVAGESPSKQDDVAASAPAHAPAPVDDVLRSGGGRPLDRQTRAYFEPRFGHDFGNVRIHTGARADTSAGSVDAIAYTVGRDVVFRSGAFTPATATGKRLLAHELAHVVQQSGGGGGAARDASSAGATTASALSPRVARQPAPEVEPAAPAMPPEAALPEAETAPDPEKVRLVEEQLAAGVPEPNAATAKGGVRATGAAAPAETAARGAMHATVHCVKKWNPCSAPYSPGTWAARTSYHCPVWPGLPGTTREAFVTIPDEFIGVDSSGRDMYRCRPRSSVVTRTDIADTVATVINLQLLYPDSASCHAGYRSLLLAALEVLFKPSGGGRPAGIRVNASSPGGGFPC
jgi:hypothetical protein